MQVFANLLNNATNYTDRDGRIWLTARREDDGVLVSVRDTGVGIPEEVLPRIFDLFAQGHRQKNVTQNGLGIGLTLVRRLVELHGGRVKARSEGAGQGSKFIVQLPLAKGPDPERVRSEPRQSTPASRHRLLLVDDNRDLADALGMLFESIGVEFHLVYDGFTALETLEKFKPTVVPCPPPRASREG